MTYVGFAFSGVASLYFYLGSMHQEQRLRRSYGEAYERYRDSGVPFFLPAIPWARVDSRQRPTKERS